MPPDTGTIREQLYARRAERSNRDALYARMLQAQAGQLSGMSALPASTGTMQPGAPAALQRGRFGIGPGAIAPPTYAPATISDESGPTTMQDLRQQALARGGQDVLRDLIDPGDAERQAMGGWLNQAYLSAGMEFEHGLRRVSALDRNLAEIAEGRTQGINPFKAAAGLYPGGWNAENVLESTPAYLPPRLSMRVGPAAPFDTEEQRRGLLGQLQAEGSPSAAFAGGMVGSFADPALLAASVALGPVGPAIGRAPAARAVVGNIVERAGPKLGPRLAAFAESAIVNAPAGGAINSLDALTRIPPEQWSSDPEAAWESVLEAGVVGAVAEVGLGGLFGQLGAGTRIPRELAALEESRRVAALRRRAPELRMQRAQLNQFLVGQETPRTLPEILAGTGIRSNTDAQNMLQAMHRVGDVVLGVEGGTPVYSWRDPAKPIGTIQQIDLEIADLVSQQRAERAALQSQARHQVQRIAPRPEAVVDRPRFLSILDRERITPELPHLTTRETLELDIALSERAIAGKTNAADAGFLTGDIDIKRDAIRALESGRVVDAEHRQTLFHSLERSKVAHEEALRGGRGDRAWHEGWIAAYEGVLLDMRQRLPEPMAPGESLRIELAALRERAAGRGGKGVDAEIKRLEAELGIERPVRGMGSEFRPRHQVPEPPTEWSPQQLRERFGARGPGHKAWDQHFQRMVENKTLLPEHVDLLREVFYSTDDGMLSDIHIVDTDRLKRGGNARYFLTKGTSTKRGWKGKSAQLQVKKGVAENPSYKGLADLDPAMIFLHEYGHIGQQWLLSDREQAIVMDAYRSFRTKSALARFFTEGTSIHQRHAAYFAKNNKEFFVQSFAEYVMSRRVSDRRLQPLFVRLISKLKEAIDRLRGRRRLEQLEPLYEKLLAGNQRGEAFSDATTPNLNAMRESIVLVRALRRALLTGEGAETEAVAAQLYQLAVDSQEAGVRLRSAFDEADVPMGKVLAWVERLRADGSTPIYQVRMIETALGLRPEKPGWQTEFIPAALAEHAITKQLPSLPATEGAAISPAGVPVLAWSELTLEVNRMLGGRHTDREIAEAVHALRMLSKNDAYLRVLAEAINATPRAADAAPPPARLADQPRAPEPPTTPKPAEPDPPPIAAKPEPVKPEPVKPVEPVEPVKPPTPEPEPVEPKPLPEGGRTGDLVLADGRTLQVRYLVVDADQLIPSHDPRRGFQPNKGGDLNERAYEDATEGKPYRETVHKIAAKPNPDILLSLVPTAVDGPPVVTPDLVVLGGNARSMALQLMYGMDIAAPGYRDAVTRLAAEQLGQDIAGIAKPVLVRILRHEDIGLRGELSRVLNQPLTTARTAITDAVARARKVQPKTIDTVAAALGDGTLAQAFNDPAKQRRILDAMTAAGAITQGELVQFLDATGALNRAGRLAVEDTLLAVAVPDTRVLASMPASDRNTVMRSLPAIVRLRRGWQAGVGIDIEHTLVDALEAHAAYRRSSDTSVMDFLDTGSLMAETWRENRPAIAMMFALDTDTPTVFTAKLLEIAAAADEAASGQGSLLGGLVESADEVFARVFPPPRRHLAMTLEGQKRSQGDRLLADIIRRLSKASSERTREILAELDDRTLGEVLVSVEPNTVVHDIAEQVFAERGPVGHPDPRAESGADIGMPAAPRKRRLVSYKNQKAPIAGEQIPTVEAVPVPNYRTKRGETGAADREIRAARARAGRDGVKMAKAHYDSIHSITRDLARRVGLAQPGVRGSRSIPRRALGFYRGNVQAIRQDYADNLSTFAHELGHYLQDVLFAGGRGNWDPRVFPEHWRGELFDLGKALYGEDTSPAYYEGEGWAEFVRYLLLNPSRVKQAAPVVYRDVVSMLVKEQPDIYRAILAARARYKALGDAKAIRQYIDFNGDSLRSGTWRDILDGFRIRWLDQYQRLSTLMRDLGMDAERTGIDRNPHVQALRVHGRIGGEIHQIMHEGIFDPARPWVVTGPSVIDALRPVADNREAFAEFMVGKRALEKREQGFDTLGKSDTGAIKRRVEQLREQFPEFESADEDLRTINQWLVGEYAVHHGLLTPESAIRIMAANQEYITFRTILHDSALSAPKAGRRPRAGMANQSSGFQRFRGSEGQQIHEPIGAFISHMENIISRANQNAAAQSLFNLTRAVPGVGRWFDRVDRPMVATKISAQNVREIIAKQLGIKLTGEGAVVLPPWLEQLDDDALAHLVEALETLEGQTFFRPGSRAKGERGQMRVLYQGKPTMWEIKDVALYRTLEGMYNPQVLDGWVKFLSIPARMIRGGATQYNPEFFVPNFFRDLMQALTMTAADGQKLGADTAARLRGLKAAFFGGDIDRMFRVSGASMAGMFSEYVDPRTGLVDMTKMFEAPTIIGRVREGQLGAAARPIVGPLALLFPDQRALAAEHLRKKGAYRGAKAIAKDFTPVLELVGALNQRFEMANRLAEFEAVRRGQTDWAAIRTAGQAAADITIDFQRGGTWAKNINRFVPFFNAALQGTDKLARFLRRDPLGAAQRIFTFLIVPSLAQIALNYNNEDYWAKPYQARDRHWYFPLGHDEQGRMKYIKVPKPYGLGIFSIATERSLARLIGIDPVTGKRGDTSVGAGNAAYEAGMAILGEMRPTFNLAGILPILEVQAGEQGWSYFFRNPIVSDGQADLPLGEQGADRSSEVARTLGRLMDYPPAKIDYLIRGYAGGLGTNVTRMLADPMLRAATGGDPTVRGRPTDATDWPIIRKFLSGATGQDHEALRRFFDTHDELGRVRRGFTARSGPDREAYLELHRGELQLYSRYSAARSAIGDQYRALRRLYRDTTLTDDQLALAIDARVDQIVSIARRAQAYDEPPRRE